MKSGSNEGRLTGVPGGATQVRETPPKGWEWVERSIWTERMLEALERGVKGGVWFSLIDKVRWPNKYFQELGYFSLYDAHRALLQPS